MSCSLGRWQQWDKVVAQFHVSGVQQDTLKEPKLQLGERLGMFLITIVLMIKQPFKLIDK